MFCLFLFEDLVKEIKLIELFINFKEKYLKEMKRRDIMWIILIVFLEFKDDILYNYKLKIKKYFLIKLDEVVDL